MTRNPSFAWNEVRFGRSCSRCNTFDSPNREVLRRGNSDRWWAHRSTESPLDTVYGRGTHTLSSLLFNLYSDYIIRKPLKGENSFFHAIPFVSRAEGKDLNHPSVGRTDEKTCKSRGIPRDIMWLLSFVFSDYWKFQPQGIGRKKK